MKSRFALPAARPLAEPCAIAVPASAGRARPAAISPSSRRGVAARRKCWAEEAPATGASRRVPGYVSTLLARLATIPNMRLSARNRLVGKIVELQLGDVMAHVVVEVGEHQVESVITRRSAVEMKLKIGDTVAAVIKSTEVMLQKA